MRRLRDWWDDLPPTVQYTLSMLAAIALLYGVAIYAAAPLMQAQALTEHRFDDGVRCYVKGGAVSCLVVRP